MVIGLIVGIFSASLCIVAALAALPHDKKPWYKFKEVRRFRKDLERL